MKQPCLILLPFFMVVMCSCQQRMYFPDRVNAPGLREAHDAKITLSAKINGNASTNDSSIKSSPISPAVDVSYAVTDHFGIMAGYRSLWNRYIDEDQDPVFTPSTVMGGLFNGHRYEAGAGYFTTFGGKGKLEIYGGLGAGQIERTGKHPEYNYKSKYYRYFIQPAIGFDVKDRFALSGGFRITMQHFYDFNSVDSLFKYHIINIDDYSTGHDVTKPLYAFVEPFLNLEMGYKFLRFNMQVNGTLPLSKYGSGISGNTPLAFYLGLSFYYAQRFFDGNK